MQNRYTTQLRSIIESESWDKHFNSIGLSEPYFSDKIEQPFDDSYIYSPFKLGNHQTYHSQNIDFSIIIERGKERIFNFPYPYYSIEQKNRLEILFIKHYYMEEIAYETFKLWHLKLDNRLNEIMPKYIRMYELAEQTMLDLMNSTNIKETYQETGTGDAKANNLTEYKPNQTSKSLSSDFPQGNINSDGDLNSNIDYATSANNTKFTAQDLTKNDAESNTRHSMDSIKNRIGYENRDLSKFMEDLNNDFYNIDALIIKACDDLFMGIW